MVVRPCDSPFVPLRARESLSGEALRRPSGNLHRPPVLSAWQEGPFGLRWSPSRNTRRGTEVVGRMVDRKGHEAKSPAEMPSPAWKDIIARTYKRIWDDNV